MTIREFRFLWLAGDCVQELSVSGHTEFWFRQTFAISLRA